MALALSDTTVEDDMPEVDTADGITEQNSVVTEDPNGSEPEGTLVAEEETNLTDNGPISDVEEARDEV